MNARSWLTTLATALAICIAYSGGLRPSAQTPANEALNPQFEKLIDRYIAEARGGGRTPGADDLSASGFERRLTNHRGFLKDLQAIDRTALSFDQHIDYRFLESILKGEIIEAERVKRWQQDPRQYLNTRPITFKLMADPRSPAVRATEMVADLELVQAQVANGKKNLNQYIPRWVELSTNVIDGFIVVLDKEVSSFSNRLTATERAPLLAEAALALAAVRDFRTFVNGELTKKPKGDYRIGAEVYNALHESLYLFPTDDMHLRRVARGMPDFTRAPAYYDWGWKQFKLVERQLEVQARKIDPNKPWLKIIREMKADHPSAEALIFAHMEAARKTRGWALDKGLVTIPWTDDDATVVAADPTRWNETGLGSAPGVPTGSSSRKSAWTINPINPDWDDATADENLSDKDYSYMYVVAPHEVYPGHFLQSLWKNENKRKLRRYESSYSNQAWCYYIEWELTPNYGFYPPEKQELYTLEMLRLKLWRMGRVINDSGLHTGRMSYDEAVALESDRIGYTRRRAQGYIDGITSRGGETAAPTLGYFEFMLLREDYFKRMRELDQKGTLKDFHDRIYQIGFLPVTLVREALFHGLEQEFRPRKTSSSGM